MTDVFLIQEKDLDSIYQFEIDNRDYFESIGLGRGQSYYNYSNFCKAYYELLEEQTQAAAFMHIIKVDNEVVGRINLFKTNDQEREMELGFRVAQTCQGKGICTDAVRQLMKLAANDYELHRITAGTSPQNIGSQIVLIKNHFTYYGKSEKYMLVNGKWKASLFFERILT